MRKEHKLVSVIFSFKSKFSMMPLFETVFKINYFWF